MQRFIQMVGRNPVKSLAIVVCLIWPISRLIELGPALPAAQTTPVDETDKSADVRSNMWLMTDYGTGCQYLSSSRPGQGGALIPRLDRNGRHICK